MILTIEKLGHLGDGIAQGPEGVVFVPGMLPGEEVTGDLQGERLANPRLRRGTPRPPAARSRLCYPRNIDAYHPTR